MKLNTVCPDCGSMHDTQRAINDAEGKPDLAVFVCSKCFTLARMENGHLIRMPVEEVMALPKEVLTKLLAVAHRMGEVTSVIDSLMGGVVPEGVQIFGDTEALMRMMKGRG
jgi:hypothetical protein